MENSKLYYYQQYIGFDGENDWGFNDEFFKTREDMNLEEIFKNGIYIKSIIIFELDIKTTKVREMSDCIYREDILKVKEFRL